MLKLARPLIGITLLAVLGAVAVGMWQHTARAEKSVAAKAAPAKSATKADPTKPVKIDQLSPLERAEWGEAVAHLQLIQVRVQAELEKAKKADEDTLERIAKAHKLDPQARDIAVDPTTGAISRVPQPQPQLAQAPTPAAPAKPAPDKAPKAPAAKQ